MAMDSARNIGNQFDLQRKIQNPEVNIIRPVKLFAVCSHEMRAPLVSGYFDIMGM